MHILDIIISNQSDTPIYQQIVKQIKNHIMTGEISEGYALPSIRALAADLQISSITTKRAYDELEREGYIYSQVGRGSFVNAQNMELLREKRVKLVEEKLQEAVDAAIAAGLNKNDLRELLDILFTRE